MPSHPQEEQLELDIPIQEMITADIQSPPKPKKPPSPQKPPVDHYRVVVWRDSRDDRVNVKVTKT